MGKLRPIWAICAKCGQKCSRNGGSNLSKQANPFKSFQASIAEPSRPQSLPPDGLSESMQHPTFATESSLSIEPTGTSGD